MLTDIKSIWRKSLQNKKLNVFGLFLLFSFLILILSKLSKSYNETLYLNINHFNVPDNRLLTSEDNSNKQLEVSVATYGFNLLALYFYDTSVDLDFVKETYVDGNSYVWITEKAIPKLETRLGRNFEIKQVQPDTMRFPFSTMAVKKVPIILQSEITYASGFDSLEGIRIEPDSVDIIGSEDDIAVIEQIQTSKLLLKSVKKNIESKVNLILPDQGSSLKLSENEVLVTAQVEKFTEGTMDIPVEIENLPLQQEINYFPKTIRVTYDVSLDNYKSIKPSDFRILCDYQDDRSRQQSFLVPQLVQFPKTVKRIKMKQNKIEYIITQ
ncbi:CdaR family protein [Psychroserpens sp. XS_ASV72]|uniref:CdaR family protein n=1 Tax=Psychroserpens sp. XS_ASV72 TaxID=3241293 RepID=UPI003515B927